jgi:RNA polymerase sigma factor (sigma-70 family)
MAPALEELSGREQQVLRLRFREELTLQETGQRLVPPLTRERVRQIEKAALVRLRQVLASA